MTRAKGEFPDCGCHYTTADDGIHYCPVHEAAFALLKACELALPVVTATHGAPAARRALHDALAAAKPDDATTSACYAAYLRDTDTVARYVAQLRGAAAAARMCDPAYTPTLDEALADPAGFVAGMTETRGEVRAAPVARHPFRTTDFMGVRGVCLDCRRPVTDPLHHATAAEIEAAKQTRYDAAVAELRARGPHAGTRWRHVKGGRYAVVFNGLREHDLVPCVAYKDLDHPDRPYWFRPLAEFLDGRFTPDTQVPPEGAPWA